MGVVLGGGAVRRPARVTDTRRAFDRLGREAAARDDQLAGRAAAVDMAVDDVGDASRVVAAILEPLETFKQQRRPAPAQSFDDSAHDSVQMVTRPIPGGRLSGEGASVSRKLNAVI